MVLEPIKTTASVFDTAIMHIPLTIIKFIFSIWIVQVRGQNISKWEYPEYSRPLTSSDEALGCGEIKYRLSLSIRGGCPARPGVLSVGLVKNAK